MTGETSNSDFKELFFAVIFDKLGTRNVEDVSTVSMFVPSSKMTKTQLGTRDVEDVSTESRFVPLYRVFSNPFLGIFLLSF